MTQPNLVKRLYSEEEYLALDAASDRPNEFWFGNVFYRGGEGQNHILIATRLRTALNNHFRFTDKEAGGSLLRMRLENPRAYAYPDIVVWADDARWSDGEQDTLLTPLVLAEITSSHTVRRDLELKLPAYKNIPLVSDYLVISPDRIHIEHFWCFDESTWHNRSLLHRDDAVLFAGLDLSVEMAEIYRDLEISEGMGDLELPLFDDET